MDTDKSVILSEEQIAEIKNQWSDFDDHDDDFYRVVESHMALQSHLKEVEGERESKLVEVLDGFRSRNIRRIDLVEALWKAGLVKPDEHLDHQGE